MTKCLSKIRAKIEEKEKRKKYEKNTVLLIYFKMTMLNKKFDSSNFRMVIRETMIQ
jgi:hypothetical protein